jgi:3-deoxy-D-manno-octulosonic-acid transferase
MRAFLWLWAAVWTLGLPLVLIYLWRRARKEPVYGTHLAERFGRHGKTLHGSVWVHAVSLGEMRSAVPLVRGLLEQGERVVTTHFTPSGRREAEAVFAAEIASGQVAVVWVPFEFERAYQRFFRSFQPKYGLVMETETWPRMIASSRRHRVPLLLCNAQYPSTSFARDTTRIGLRAELMTGFAGMLVKSELQADRFRSVGVGNIAVTGELRFDQPMPERLVAAGRGLRIWIGAARPVVTLASVVVGEDDVMLGAIRSSRAAYTGKGLEPPLFVYVPRAPERFDEVAGLIEAEGLRVGRRSRLLDPDLLPLTEAPVLDVLLGDSLGEMYAWLAMCDRVVVGGGFTPKGSHNISEPLAMARPVMVGPDIHTIEYPAVEAIAAGVCRHLRTPEDLAEALAPGCQDPSQEAIRAFLATHSGGVEKTLEAIPALLTSR